jgi:phage baseplate assembly protein W
MATYYGFSTQGLEDIRRVSLDNKSSGSGQIGQPTPRTTKYMLTDQALVIQDLLNAFNIDQGSKPGNPGYGSMIRRFLFEPNTLLDLSALEREIRRVVSQDPRIILNDVYINSQENGVLFQLEMAIQPFNEPIDLAMNLSQQTGQVSLA